MSQLNLIPSNRAVVDALVAGMGIGSYSHLAETRETLGNMLRASMLDTAKYGNALDWTPIAGCTYADLVNNLHPFNVAAALVAVCGAGPAFNGAALLPQQDLAIYLQSWVPLHQCSAEANPITAPVAAAPPPPPAPPPAPPPFVPAPVDDGLDLGTLAAGLTAAAPPSEGLTGQPAPRPADAQYGASVAPTAPVQSNVVPIQPQAPVQMFEPVQEPPAPQPEIPASTGPLPSPDVRLTTSAGKPGRPFKSSFEREHKPRTSISKPPFWWEEMQPRWHLLFVESPAVVVGNESSGNAPLISYAAMVHTMQMVLYNVPNHVTAGEMKAYLARVRENIANSASAPVAFSLSEQLFVQK